MSHQKRPLPTETVDGLRPPQAGFPYFSGASAFRFQPAATSCLPVNCWWLADASFLVYGDADFIEQAIESTALPDQGYRITWLGNRVKNCGMMLCNDTAMIVVFRGTRQQQHSILNAAEIVTLHQHDLWTDSQFLRQECAAGGKVHRGFLKAYAKVSEQLEAAVAAKSDQQALWFTGHSMGGALAVIAATHFLPQLQRVCSFGVPRVGNREFASLLPNLLHDRFVHREDWVTTVPPSLIGYRHNGTRQEVPGSEPRQTLHDFARGTQQLVGALKSMARDLKISTGELPLKIAGLADHAPIYYATLLWNALIAEPQQDESSGQAQT